MLEPSLSPPTRMRSYSLWSQHFFVRVFLPSFVAIRIHIKRIWLDWSAHERTCIFHMWSDAFFLFHRRRTNGRTWKPSPTWHKTWWRNECTECVKWASETFFVASRFTVAAMADVFYNTIHNQISESVDRSLWRVCDVWRFTIRFTIYSFVICH